MQNFTKIVILYPTPCMFGFIASNFINAATDISDGFYGDLNKILNNKVGAILFNKRFFNFKEFKKYYFKK